MKLISVEGIEGVGKSTQINLIQEWLKIKGFSSKLIREPGSTEFGEKIRELLLSNDSNISAHSELLLMFAAVRDLDPIKEATASACIRSIFPFIKDLIVNSPGFASRSPKSSSALNRLSTIMGLPCVVISTRSSPV